MSNAIGRLYEELHFCQKSWREIMKNRNCAFVDSPLLFAPEVYMHLYIQVWTSLRLTMKCHLDDLSYHPKNSTLKKTAIVFCHFNEQPCVTVCDQ